VIIDQVVYLVTCPLLVMHSKTKKKKKNRDGELSTAAHTYNPSYVGGRDREYHSFRPVSEASLGNKLVRSPS
jgi:hypothetical protein